MIKKDCCNNCNVQDVVKTTLTGIKENIDVSVVTGKEIKVDNNITIIPVIKVCVGVVAGGADSNKNKNNINYPFAGGSGTGYTLLPIGFLSVNGESVSFINTNITSKGSEILDLTARIFKETLSGVKKENNESEN